MAALIGLFVGAFVGHMLWRDWGAALGGVAGFIVGAKLNALRAGEIVGIFPEGKLTDTGELNPFRPGVQQMLAATPVPVVPMALSGLWGSFFSRSHGGKAMRGLRGIFSRIAFVVAPPVPPERVTLDGLESTVLALRGERR